MQKVSRVLGSRNVWDRPIQSFMHAQQPTNRKGQAATRHRFWQFDDLRHVCRGTPGLRSSLYLALGESVCTQCLKPAIPGASNQMLRLGNGQVVAGWPTLKTMSVVLYVLTLGKLRHFKWVSKHAKIIYSLTDTLSAMTLSPQPRLRRC